MSPRTVIVIGATGSQGGPVARELLKSPHLYHVRALTRDPSKPAAQELAELGADVQAFDLNAGIDALLRAFTGADAIFAMTDFWATRSAKAEATQGRTIIDAAALTSNLEHFIWSSLPDPEKVSGGILRNIHHWKSKSLVADYIQQQYPELWGKTTVVLFPNYFENCLSHPERYLSQPDAQGVHHMYLPHSPSTVMPNGSIRDTGKLVRLFLEDGATYFTKTVAFYSEAISEAAKQAMIGKKYGLQTMYHVISPDEHQKKLESQGLSPEIALDYTEQLLMFENFGNVCDAPGIIQANEISGLRLQSWAEFLEENDILANMNAV
ncbi:NmrA-like family protein [Aspergillus eucalypticola CBS 122712]|uniref:NmrA-like family protein n=1 Tax=Aspergillus eucalypticola (strain CBS 122712 / IBT 29274) TaxID=1448314 RepID=A0A317V380_ASPEC|nr:NmrA-like family protein [Aspergillus eucalypticola CBS 122712]PWY68724.1 NmrA-like family protein [Aspergillus eucalypticola CBS 122712]